MGLMHQAFALFAALALSLPGLAQQAARPVPNPENRNMFQLNDLDSYRRFMQMFGSVVLEIPKDAFEHELEDVRRFRPDPRAHPHSFRRTAATPAVASTAGWTASCLGGAAVVYGGVSLRARPGDLALRRRLGDIATASLVDWPIDYAALAPQNPRLVYCSITGFGQTGPLKEKPGYDYIFQGVGGLMSVTDLGSMGAAQSCTLAEGIGQCWGANEFGQLGNGAVGQSRTLPERCRRAGTPAGTAGAVRPLPFETSLEAAASRVQAPQTRSFPECSVRGSCKACLRMG